MQGEERAQNVDSTTKEGTKRVLESNEGLFLCSPILNGMIQRHHSIIWLVPFCALLAFSKIGWDTWYACRDSSGINFSHRIFPLNGASAIVIHIHPFHGYVGMKFLINRESSTWNCSQV
jgi:hypothetical protein